MQFKSRILLLLAITTPLSAFNVEKAVIRDRHVLKSSSYFDSFENPRNVGTAGSSSDASAEPLYNVGALSKANIPTSKNIWREDTTALIQGNTLRTWPLTTYDDMVQISMATEGRPLNANIELWQGPDYTPMTMKVYIEDGNLRPLNAIILTPQASNTIAVYNTGNMEFPFFASVEETVDPNFAAASNSPYEWSSPQRVQGGAVKTFPFDPAVQSVQVMLNTDGRNLNARLELMQGPNNDKQILEIYATDGIKCPLYVVIETPGSGNVIRLINQNPMEFPFTAYIGPYEVDAGATN